MLAVVVDDFLRTPINGMVHHDSNLHWLAEIAESLSGGSYSIAAPRFDAARYMDALSLPTSREGWLQAVDAEPSASYTALLGDDLGGADIVIGFGLSNTTIRALDTLGISFVDIEISPIRFMDDLGLDVRTNIDALARSSHMAFDDADAQSTAAIIRGRYVRAAYDTIPADVGSVGVIFGQMNHDTALVSDGRFARFSHHRDAVLNWAEGLDHVLFRPHPYAEDLHHFNDLKAILPSIRPTLVNSYQLLACRGIDRVLAISSGIAQEACYFRPSATRLISPFRRRTGHPSSIYAALDVLRGDVLEGALQGAQVPEASRRNYQLRKQIGSVWGATDEVSRPDFLTPPIPFRSRFIRNPIYRLGRRLRRLVQ